MNSRRVRTNKNVCSNEFLTTFKPLTNKAITCSNLCETFHQSSTEYHFIFASIDGPSILRPCYGERVIQPSCRALGSRLKYQNTKQVMTSWSRWYPTKYKHPWYSTKYKHPWSRYTNKVESSKYKVPNLSPYDTLQIQTASKVKTSQIKTVYFKIPTNEVPNEIPNKKYPMKWAVCVLITFYKIQIP